jgi:hypothetical protein
VHVRALTEATALIVALPSLILALWPHGPAVSTPSGPNTPLRPRLVGVDRHVYNLARSEGG